MSAPRDSHCNPSPDASTGVGARRSRLDRWVVGFIWLLLSLPAFYQIWLLGSAVVGRIGYDYDLEWMEGGMLVHAFRLAEGLPIYAAPSVDFIPYLYTPGYPAVIAALGSVFGLSYQTARVISVAAMLGCVGLVGAAVVRAIRAARRDDADRLWWPVGVAAWASGVGVYASGYPWMDGWYDIARADSLLVAVVAAGMFGLVLWGRPSAHNARSDGAGLGDWVLSEWFDGRIVGCAALLAAGFFVKQTGVIFVVAGGAALVCMNWRMLPCYVATSGAIGLGGTYAYNVGTDGWFWTYIYAVHQRHVNSGERFWDAFGLFVDRCPLAVAVVALALVAVAIYAAVRRRLPRSGGAFLFWAYLFGISVVVGAVGLTTQWSYRNAMIPAFVFGAFASAAAVVVIAEMGRAVGPRVATAGVFLVLGALAFHAYDFSWKVEPLSPTAADEAAGDRLVELIGGADGPVFVPYFPWYAHLAGKPVHVHRMSITDVTRLTPRRCPEPGADGQADDCQPLPDQIHHIEGLAENLEHEVYGLVILGARNPAAAFGPLSQHYRPSQKLGADQRPSLLTAHNPRGLRVWRPVGSVKAPPGARVVFDFEGRRLPDWTIRGRAWGRGPIRDTLAHQLPIGGFGGQRLMNSFHGADPTTGTAVSPPFEIHGDTLVVHVGGGDAKGVRAELRRLDGSVVRIARGDNTEILHPVRWDVSELGGKKVRLALVDQSTAGWGHLLVDEVWDIP